VVHRGIYVVRRVTITIHAKGIWSVMEDRALSRMEIGKMRAVDQEARAVKNSPVSPALTIQAVATGVIAPVTQRASPATVCVSVAAAVDLGLRHMGQYAKIIRGALRQA